MARLLRDTPDETVFEDRPWFVGLALAAMVLFAAFLVFRAWEDGDPVLAAAALFMGGSGILGLRTAVRVTRLTLRSDGAAILETRDRRGGRRRELAPGTLRAGLETSNTGDGPSYRAMLLIDGPDGVERVPLTSWYSGSPRHAGTVARITEWRTSTT